MACRVDEELRGDAPIAVPRAGGGGRIVVEGERAGEDLGDL